MMKSLFITAVILFLAAGCKRGTDPHALAQQLPPAPSDTTSSPADITFTADDTTGAAFNTDAATTTAVPEAVVKETAQEQVTKKTNVKPPAGKKKSAEKTRPAPAQYSNPKTWTATQKKWADVIGQRGSLQVGQATTLMTTDATKAKGIYALYATERYLALGNETAAEEQWIKFQIERNGLHSALLNSLFEVSKLCDHGFATFVANKAAQQKAPSKKKKKKS